MDDTCFTIAPAMSAADLRDVATLFADYAASLAVDLAFQDFANEAATLPGRYAPPTGALLLARDPDRVALGCVALRALDGAGVCEMKRLYVAPVARGLGLGRALVDAAIATATRIGHREMRLDTLPDMAAAIALYAAIGFVPTAAYYDTPIAGTVFLVRRL